MRIATGLLLIIASATGCSSVRTKDVSSVPSYTLDAINASPEETVGKAMTTGAREVVVEFRKGDRVPVNLRASLGPISLQPGEDSLVFSRDVYFYISQGAFLVSTDKKRWAPVQDGAALNEVLGTKTGTFQLGFGVKKGEKAAFTVAMDRK